MSDQPIYDIKSVASMYSDAMLKAIGHLFLACATTETALRYELLRLHHHGSKASANSFLLLSGMETKVTLEKIIVGTSLVKPDCRTEIARICDKIRTIFERRNEIAHNTALLGGGDHLTLGIVKLTSAGRYTVTKTFHTKQINGFADSLYQHVRHLTETLKAHGIDTLPEQLELNQ